MRIERQDSLMYRFDSQDEILNFTDESKFQAGKEEFVGMSLPEWDAVKKTAESNWKEGIETLERYINDLQSVVIPQLKSTIRKTTWTFDADADDIDFERMMNGEAYARKVERESGDGPPTVTVFIDTTTPCFEQSMNILWRGAAAIAMAIILEEKGYPVEIWAVNGSYLFARKHHPVITCCRLKAPGDTIDRSTMVNMVSGWFYRTSTFTLLETICSVEEEPVASGYGMCYSPNSEQLDELSRDGNRVYASGVFSQKGAEALICDEVEKLAFQSEA